MELRREQKSCEQSTTVWLRIWAKMIDSDITKGMTFEWLTSNAQRPKKLLHEVCKYGFASSSLVYSIFATDA